MIIDITGIELSPGRCGSDCPGNGEHIDETGNRIECCCDECNYMMCCIETFEMEKCSNCSDFQCPRAGR